MEKELFITDVQPQKKKKDRYNIFIDGEYAASLGAETCVLYNIKQGQTVVEDDLKTAVCEDNTKYAFDSAANLLAHKMRTKSELVKRLKEKGIGSDAISAAIEKLAGYGYVDDSAYAKEYVESAVTAAKLGRRTVEYRLKEKGVDDDIIADALLTYTYETEKDIAKKNIETLMLRYRNDDAPTRRRKISQALARHGFDYDIINALLSGDDGL